MFRRTCGTDGHPCLAVLLQLLPAATLVSLVSLALLTVVLVLAYKSISTRQAKQRKECLEAVAKQTRMHQVFLNHTGQDQRAMDFTASVLAVVLRNMGVPVFIDHKMEQGVEWKPVLAEAAANSKVFVAVLSAQYCKRRWCMLELDLALNACKMLQQCEQPPTPPTPPHIIPVFLDDHGVIVQPLRICLYWQWSQVCSWLGTPRSHSVSWIAPRIWAGNVSNLMKFQHVRSNMYPGKDGLHQLAQDVAKAVFKKIPRLLDNGSSLGLDKEVDELHKLLGTELGVWLSGVGGVGKTTLGMQVYNSVMSSGVFDCCACVELGYVDPKGCTKSALKDQLVDTLTQLGCDGELRSSSSAALRLVLKERVKQQRVLYMLDNVATGEQLEYLLPTQWKEGSVVIITSRKEKLENLMTAPISPAMVQLAERLLLRPVLGLDSSTSMELFRKCAGIQGPLTDPRCCFLEQQLVDQCAGLPLALEIVGGGLSNVFCSQDFLTKKLTLTRALEDALKAFKQHGHNVHDTRRQLQVIIEHSVHNDASTIQMLLDVATVMHGWPMANAIAVWEHEGWHGVAARQHLLQLQQCSLVKVDQQGLLQMHDAVAAVARGMARDATKPRFCSRLWVEENMVMGVPQALVTQTKGAGHRVLIARLDAICNHSSISRDQTELPEFTRAGDLNWSEAKVVLAGRAPVPQSLNRDLLWLEVNSWTQLVADPSTDGTVGDVMTELRGLCVSNCSGLDALPECLSSMQQLQRLVPSAGCSLLVGGLEHIATLPALRVLHLKGCHQLLYLPACLNLPRLQELRLTDCHSLMELPSSLSRLQNLQRLHLTGCTRLTALPDTLAQLALLNELHLSGWCQLEVLQDWLGDLTALQLLDLSGCSKLASLPDRVSQLTNLEVLYLSNCTNLTELSQFIDGLASLEKLHLNGCSSLKHLPEAVAQLKALRCLQLRDCQQLSSLPHHLGQLAGTLQELVLHGCNQLCELPVSVEHLSEVARLSIGPIYMWHQQGKLREMQLQNRACASCTSSSGSI